MDRERDVERKLCKLVEEAGGRCDKFIPDANSGMPDRLIMLPGGVLVWAETKRPQGGRLSALQRYQHGQLRKLGQRVEVVWSKDQAGKLVEELARKADQVQS